MITDNMTLNSKNDAKQWASDFGLETDEQEKKLAEWIWSNKPSVGCTKKEHPVSGLSEKDFWEIVE